MERIRMASATRVSQRWIRAATLHAKLDAMARLQVLEGAFGLADGPWSSAHDPEAGLQQAKAWVADHPSADLRREWFLKPSTDTYFILARRVQTHLDKAGVTNVSIDDVMQEALGGIGKKGQATKKPLYAAGQWLSAKVLSGEEYPEKVASGLGGRFFFRKALNAISVLRNNQGATGPQVNVGPHEQDDGRAPQAGPSILDEKTRLTVFTELFTDQHDPLGQKVRDFLRATWRNWSDTDRKYLDFWMDTIESTGRVLGTSEIGKAFAKNPQDATEVRGLVNGSVNRTWVKFKTLFPQISSAFWSSALGGMVEDRYEHAGLRAASVRIAARYMAR